MKEVKQKKFIDCGREKNLISENVVNEHNFNRKTVEEFLITGCHWSIIKVG